jgi:hypothetical protein
MSGSDFEVYYCRRCRRPVSKEESDAGRGYCEECIAQMVAETQAAADREAGGGLFHKRVSFRTHCNDVC